MQVSFIKLKFSFSCLFFHLIFFLNIEVCKAVIYLLAGLVDLVHGFRIFTGTKNCWTLIGVFTKKSCIATLHCGSLTVWVNGLRKTLTLQDLKHEHSPSRLSWLLSACVIMSTALIKTVCVHEYPDDTVVQTRSTKHNAFVTTPLPPGGALSLFLFCLHDSNILLHAGTWHNTLIFTP